MGLGVSMAGHLENTFSEWQPSESPTANSQSCEPIPFSESGELIRWIRNLWWDIKYDNYGNSIPKNHSNIISAISAISARPHFIATLFSLFFLEEGFWRFLFPSMLRFKFGFLLIYVLIIRWICLIRVFFSFRKLARAFISSKRGILGFCSHRMNLR